MKQFNGNRLKNARLYRGLTVEELAEKIEVSKQTVSQYENDKIVPTFEKILSLSGELQFPYEYFIQSDSFKVKSGSTYFRSLLKTNKKYRIEQSVKMEHLAVIYSFLKDYVEFPKLNLPKNEKYASPTEAGRILREFWGLGEEPISDMIRVLEENGVIATMFRTSTDDIDAFSQLIEVDGQDIFLVALSKNKDTAVRTHFDVAHELGHIMLHEWSEDVESLTREQFKEREKEANEFAAAFLLPETPFRRDVSVYSNNLEYYIQLKKKWKVSTAAMLYRSCDLGLITQNQYQYMIRIMQKKNWRKNEPFDNILKTAKPSLLSDAIEVLLVNNVFTPSEFMKELSKEGLAMNSREVEMLLDLPQDMLKPRQAGMGKIVSLKADLSGIDS
ncbi:MULTISPECIES: helix-turn-helix domain-containing protein [Dehalobacter]|jgi:Zn-dependent peptidase ImmA (M78 family)/DNA-binding XRE family transcriptional regulator|uniref:ImmA/IrrE family metallo-endopeptidase n=1 Tax=Dehalobacter restrictus TaxID=55583 RepID=A0A857DF81_9FIRM|nr:MULTISPECIES: XRE family transcriptional regulator [Dehalobacter]MCG1024976.1 ImmA/IrrE family metallo-endopeptidase [Dehalobacter sp.]QGZ99546.1 ImmA/IrrE family metallo-endopeptidase [Dehalobacter restrictus]